MQPSAASTWRRSPNSPRHPSVSSADRTVSWFLPYTPPTIGSSSSLEARELHELATSIEPHLRFEPHVLVHRNLVPGNVIAQKDTSVKVVSWGQACVSTSACEWAHAIVRGSWSDVLANLNLTQAWPHVMDHAWAVSPHPNLDYYLCLAQVSLIQIRDAWLADRTRSLNAWSGPHANQFLDRLQAATGEVLAFVRASARERTARRAQGDFACSAGRQVCCDRW